MPTIIFTDVNGGVVEVNATSGESLMQAARDANIEGIDAHCGGQCAEPAEGEQHGRGSGGARLGNHAGRGLAELGREAGAKPNARGVSPGGEICLQGEKAVSAR